MGVSALNAKFRSLRNLKIAATTLYALVYQEQDDLPAIIDELAKHASKTRLSPRDARRVIKIGIGRRQYGDHPDATLVQLAELNGWSQAWHEKAVAALLEREPDTDETASALGNARAAHPQTDHTTIEA